MFLLVVVSLVVAQTQAITLYPPFARCNGTIVSQIKSYWKTAGPPKRGIELLTPGEKYYASHTSFTYNNEGTKCVYAELNDRVMSVTLIPENGSPNIVLKFQLTLNNDGSATLTPTDKSTSEKHKMKIYNLYGDDGVLIAYLCSETKEEVHEPAVTAFCATKKSYAKQQTKDKLNYFYNLLKGWGFHFAYTYVDVCF